VAPAGTPKEVVQRLNAEINSIANQAVVKELLATQGLELWPSTSEQFAKQIKLDYEKYGRIVKQANIKFD
jgi:tripartite-type tricarboxylate transporter receptor subunit TctC